MKKLISKLALCLTVALAASADPISEYTLNSIRDFRNLSMELSSEASPDAAIQKINAFESTFNAALDQNAKDREQESLIMESLCRLEEFNYRYDDPAGRKQMFKVLGDMVDKNSAFIAKNKNNKEGISKWMYIVTGDSMACYMSSSIGNILKYGLKNREYYEKAYAIDPNLSYLNLCLAQWYYMAPGISGGSVKKARSYFETALSKASTKGERYYANIFLSQFLFEQKEKDKAASLLSAAQAEYPQSRYVRLIQEQNANGVSLFKYNRQRSQLD